MDFKNNYFIMRHGQSEANEAGIVISSPENGIEKYGLTSYGVDEVKNSLKNSKVYSIDIIYSSDFKRAHETAEIAADYYSVGDVITTALLRERFFGDYECTSTRNYEKIWEMDENNPKIYPANVESSESVKNRTLSLINELEIKYNNKNILLVAHGDVLQILYAALKNIQSNLHRSIVHIKTAEIRSLIDQ